MTPRPTNDRTSQAPVLLLVVRAVAGLYPAPFRRRYGPELCDLVESLAAESRYRGPWGRFRLWAHVTGDLLPSIVRQRVRTLRRPRGMAATFAHLRRVSPRAWRFDMRTAWEDIRFAWRSLRSRPAFTVVALGSLAVGIGANSLIFGLADGLVLRPFRYPDVDRLVTVGVAFPRLNTPEAFIEVLSPAEYLDIREARTLERTMAFDLGYRTLGGGRDPQNVFTALVWGDFFRTIDVPPLMGRGLVEADWQAGATPVAVISYRVWQGQFGGNPAVVGTAIRVNGRPVTLVGVMPPHVLVLGTDLWLPLATPPSAWPRQARQLSVLGRIAPGYELDDVRAELSAIAGRVEQTHRSEFREYEGWRLSATPWAAAVTRAMHLPALVLLAAVGCVLVIACANLASLQLARTVARQPELAVRLALGANRWRLAQHLLAESLVLGLGGGALGLMVAWLGLRTLPSVLPPELMRLDPVLGINGRVAIYGAALAFLSALLVGSLSAWHAAREVSANRLREGRSAVGSRGARRARHALVVAEIALAVILVTGAGLLIRTLAGLSALSPGFDPRSVLTMRLTLPAEKYRGDAIATFFGSLEQRVALLPGVRSVGVASQFPPFGFSSRRLEIEGRSAPTEGTLPAADVTIASRGFFTALGTPVVRGRGFQPGDTAEAPRVALVNATFAARFLPGESPVGRRIREVRDGRPAAWVEIVGVVTDARNHGLHQPVEPEVFLSDVQARGAWNQLFLLVRTTGSAAGMLPSIRAVVRELDPDLPVYMIQTLEDAFRESLLRQRLTLTLLGLLAVLAVGLAAIGLYGVMSFVVGARTREIGVRMSLGATAGSVRRLVLRQALALAVTGVAVGLAGAMLTGRALAALLVGVSPRDPFTLAAVTVALVAVALAAAYVPARRASRVDPLGALRGE